MERERGAELAAGAVRGGELVVVERELGVAIAERGDHAIAGAGERRERGGRIAERELDGAEVELEQRALIGAQRIGGGERVIEQVLRGLQLAGIAVAPRR